MRILRVLWWRFVVAHRYVSVERFQQEHRAYVAAEMRYEALRQWVEDKRHHGTDRPNWQRIQTEAWQYAVRCVPIKRGR